MKSNGKQKAHLFHLGRVIATTGAIRAMLETDEGLGTGLMLLQRHATGDWGTMDAEDKAANDQALKSGGRIFSAYVLSTGVKLWVITEADRSATTFLLPEEY